MFILTLVFPSVLLSAFALQAVEAERRARLAEHASRLQGEARQLVQGLDEVFREPLEQLELTLNATRVTRAREVAPALARLVAEEPLLTSFFVLDAGGRRVHPAGPPGSPELGWPPRAVLGGLASATLPPDPLVALEDAADLVREGQPQRAMRLLERAARRGSLRARATALYDLGRLQEGSETLSRTLMRVQEGTATLSGLLNAQEGAYAELARYPIDLVDLRGRPAPAWARFRLALLDHAINQTTFRTRLRELLSELERSAPALPAETVAELSERAAALLEDADALTLARGLAERRWAVERRVARLEATFGQVLGAALSQGGPLDRVTGRIEGARTAGGVPFVKARRADGYDLLAYAVIRGPDQRPLGLVAVEVDVPAVQAAFERRVATDPWGSRLGPWEEGRGGGEGARAQLLAPFDHLGIEVSGRPDAPSVVEDALDLPRETVQLWAIALAVGGLVAGVVVTTRTIRREAKAAQLKSDFVSNVTHELKTPLTSIRMFLETLLLDRVDSEAERKEFLEVMNRETLRLGRLIEQLLVFSRIENKKWRVRFSAEDPRELVGEAVRVLADQLGKAPADLQIEVVAVQEIPLVPVDRFAMVEALLNLLHNAWKYSPEATRHVRVVIADRRRQLEIAVEDNGIGVPARDRRRIFVKFERGSNAEQSRIEGSGIGLTLATEIAKAHGGSVRYTPLKPAGSRFSVFLPR